MLGNLCTVACASSAFIACLVAWVVGPHDAPPLHAADPVAQAHWLNLTRARASWPSLEQIEQFNMQGRLLLHGAVPAMLVEKLLLPSLEGMATPSWASLLLWHVRDRFETVRYGLWLHSAQIRDFWQQGPAASIVGSLLDFDSSSGNTTVSASPVLLADAYYAVGVGSKGLPFHTDSETSYCLAHRDAAGVSFWLALDNASDETGGGLEVCDTRLHPQPASPPIGVRPSCEVYSVRRGDVVLFSRHSEHRTRPWMPGVPGLRRALVGRLVSPDARLRYSRTPAGLIHSNAFDGQYLCDHGLEVGDLLSTSMCFPSLGRDAAGESMRGQRLRLHSPSLSILQHAIGTALFGIPLNQGTALALTLAFELGSTYLWWCLQAHRGKCSAHSLGRVLAASAAASLMTHPFVWLWASVVFPHAGYMGRIVAIEALITVAESLLLYWLALCDMKLTIGSSVLLSCCMNGCSVILGHITATALRMKTSALAVHTSAMSWLLGAFLIWRLRTSA